MKYRVEGSRADDFYGGVEVVTLGEMILVLDDIESNVLNALKAIDQIEGIEDINKCKFILKEVLMKL